jgi:phage terminase large subunit-like protein
VSVAQVGGFRGVPIIGTLENGGGAIPAGWLRPMNTPTLRAEGPGPSAYRREITRDPLIFALVYLPHLLTMEVEGGRLISFSPWHIDAFDRMGAWLALGGPQRHATFAPRKAAKTTIYYVVGILFAVAQGVARFPLALSNNAAQVEGHLAKVHAELVGNPYGLLDDFPHLRPVKATQRDIVTANGVQISARSMDAGALGISSQTNDRPDLILIDDPEPDADHYSMGAKGKRLGTLLNAVLPMNEDAIVEWTGTVTMYGSLAHDLVLHARGERTAGWIEETGFTADHYPAIVDEGTPMERSLWPQRWPLDSVGNAKGLHQMKYPRWPDRTRVSRAFALNYDNRPESAGGLYWTRDLIRHTPRAVSASYLLSIDTAVTNGPAADMTALTIVGQAPDGRHLTIEWNWAGRITGIELRDLVHDLLAENPTLRDILIEGNQGGDRWLDILSPPEKPLPQGITVTIGRPEKRGSKRNRLEWLLAQYELELIGHRQRFAELEDQMLAWPKVAHDDRMDTVEAAAAYFLGKPVR